LVKHLARNISERASLVATITADRTISDAVRTAALPQTETLLLYWPPLVDGHRAAKRGNWRAAIEAFEQVTKLASDDVMHWHWLAAASIAADQREAYQRACDGLLRCCDRNAGRTEYYWTLRTWLALPHDANELDRIHAVVDAARGFHESRWFEVLNDLRVCWRPAKRFGPTNPHPIISPTPDEWYILAMASHAAGDDVHAHSAYQEGLRLARTFINWGDWYTQVYRETLRAEVEVMLASDSSAAKAAPPPVTGGGPSPSVTPLPSGSRALPTSSALK
jgi:hypothetical protein